MRVGFCCLQAGQRCSTCSGKICRSLSSPSVSSSAISSPAISVLLPNRLHALASPAMMHWGTCPSISNNFSVHFRAAQSLTAAFVQLPLQIYLYSASAAVVVQSRRELWSVYYFVLLYETNDFHAVLCPLEPHHGDVTVCTPVPPPDFRSRWCPWPGRIGVGATGHVPPYCL